MNLFSRPPQNAGLSGHAPDSREDKLAWMQLSRTEGIGPITFFQMVDFYGSAQDVLKHLPQIEKSKKRKKPLNIPSRDTVERELSDIEKSGGDVITAGDPRYPVALAAIPDAPPVLTVLGNIALLQSPCVGVVGSRNASLNGCKFAEQLARELGAQDKIIVSGLARGIDAAAHKGALETGTVAVVAGGADVIYPQENKELYAHIRETGLIIAENPWGMPPRNRDFPRRNRIISGLSDGVVVVEATLRSGSLITARLAAEQGRDVYAVPGFPYDPRAEGPNALIRDGAVLVRHAEDVLENMRSFIGTNARANIQSFENTNSDRKETETNQAQSIDIEQLSNTDGLHETVLSHLSSSPLGLDELARACQMTIAELQYVIFELELNEQIRRLPGNKVVLL